MAFLAEGRKEPPLKEEESPVEIPKNAPFSNSIQKDTFPSKTVLLKRERNGYLLVFPTTLTGISSLFPFPRRGTRNQLRTNDTRAISKSAQNSLLSCFFLSFFISFLRSQSSDMLVSL